MTDSTGFSTNQSPAYFQLTVKLNPCIGQIMCRIVDGQVTEPISKDFQSFLDQSLLAKNNKSLSPPMSTERQPIIIHKW